MGIVVLRLANHQTIAVEREAVDAVIEEVVARQFDIQAVLEEVFADAERKHGIGAIEPGVLLIAVGMDAKVSLQQPTSRRTVALPLPSVRQSNDVA